MIERTHPKLSVGAQCRLLSILRSSFCYAPQGETALNLDLMLLIDKQFLETPFYGVRQMTWHLQDEGHAVNEKRIRRENGPPDRFLNLLTADLPETRYQQACEGAQDLPLSGSGGLRVDRPNQVWCPDITCLPMRKGFLYLVAIMGWFTRKVLAWRISNIEPWSATGPRTMARGGRVLRRGPERGHPHVRPARDHEHGAWSRHRSERPCDARAASSRPWTGPIG